jgi:hypothetical protein
LAAANASNATAKNIERRNMNKVRFETSGALGFLTLANPPLNLFDEELIEDLRTSVNPG